MNHLILRHPSHDLLPDYIEALRTGWSPDNLRPAVAQEQLKAIEHDADSFLARVDDPEAKGPPVVLPDGSQVARLPGLQRWIWKDGFCGSIGLRWQPGTNALPPTCLGHIGYAVVPWRRREGLATAALLEIRALAIHVGLQRLDITADVNNLASIGVITKAGGLYVKDIDAPKSVGGHTSRLYRIDL